MKECMRASRDAELALIKAADLTRVVSEQERTVVHQHITGAPIHIVSLIMPELSRPIYPRLQRQGVLFMCSLTHLPNAKVSVSSECLQ